MIDHSVTPARTAALASLAPQPVSRCLADVRPERVTWLAPARVPFGKPTVLEGPPGLGKSSFTLDLAARLSRGEGLPGDPPLERAATVLLTAEDGLGDTVRPRLEAAGADCSLVHAIEAFVRPDGELADLVLPDVETMLMIEQQIEEVGARLVIIDVLAAYLSNTIDSYKDQHIRGVLRPLAALAERTNTALVVVRHLRKAGGGRAIYADGE